MCCELYILLKTKRFPQKLVTFNDEQRNQLLLGDKYTQLPQALEVDKTLKNFVSRFLALDLCWDTCTPQITGGSSMSPDDMKERVLVAQVLGKGLKEMEMNQRRLV